jgi:AcrR family transcriptional regulator
MNEKLFIEKGRVINMPKSKEQCEEIREATKQKIIRESILYFSRNGFAGTKISELSKAIGIAQGTIYNYFESKEDLFIEINKVINHQDLNQLKRLAKLPIPAKMKIRKLSEEVLRSLQEEPGFAEMITLGTQQTYGSGENVSAETSYQNEVYKLLAEIVEQGQKEGSIVQGSVMKLVDYYWGVVYLYALKKLFTREYEMINAEDLDRILLK